MAIDLIVHLTDQEQAKILEIAAIVAPGKTPTQVKNWAEKQAKDGLREAVTRVLNDHNNKSFEEAWPGPDRLPVDIPPLPPEQA